MLISMNTSVERPGYCLNRASSRAKYPIWVAGRISSSLLSSTGGSEPLVASTWSSISLIVASASACLPCMICQRGDSGRLRRT